MAKCMQHLQKYSDVPFDVEYLVMNPGYNEINKQKIIENAKILDIPIKMFETQIFDVVADIEDSPCYLWCNKIALGHHFDDVIETILMGMLYGGQVQTMMPKLHSSNFEGMELIRPLYMVKEEDIISWKNYNDLQFIQCACRFTESCTMCDNGGGGSKRQEMKSLIKSFRKINPNIENNIFRSVENVNLETIISYHKGDERHHFLDDYS